MTRRTSSSRQSAMRSDPSSPEFRPCWVKRNHCLRTAHSWIVAIFGARNERSLFVIGGYLDLSLRGIVLGREGANSRRKECLVTARNGISQRMDEPSDTNTRPSV